jgi:type IV pilus assembly protein PilQ
MKFTKTGCVVRSAVAAVVVAGVGVLSATYSYADSKEKVQQPASSSSAGETTQSAGQQASAPQPEKNKSTITAYTASGTNRVVIATGVVAPKYSVTRLHSPERLVVDLEATTLAHTHPLKTKELEFVSGVRVGAHPDKTRVVIDLRDSKDVAHEARVDGGTITLIVAPQAGSKQPLQQESQKAVPQPIKEKAPQIAREAATSQQPQAVPAKVESAKVPAVKPAVAEQLNKNTKPARSGLALDEEPVSSGTSKTDASTTLPAEAAAPLKQPVALQQGSVSSAGMSSPVAADRARLSFPALERRMRAARAIASSSDTDVSSMLSVEVLSAVRAASPDTARSTNSTSNEPKQENKDSSKVTEQGAQPSATEPVRKEKDMNVAKPAGMPLSAVEREAMGESKDARTQEASAIAAVAEEKPIAQEVVAVQPVTDLKAQQPTLAKISSVTLETNGAASPSVMIVLPDSVEYAMTRTAPSEYVVTLNDASVEASLLQKTLFAASNSSGIRSVRTVVDGAQTLVRIFTQPSSYLTVKRANGALRVEETQDLAQIARDIRAQIAPAAAKESDAGKDAKEVDPKAKKPASAQDKASPTTAKEENGGSEDSELAAIKGNSTTYTGRLISLDLQDADIDSALRIIAEVSNLNIVAGEGVVGKVTLKLADVPWDQALEVILKSHGLDKVLEGNVLRVAPVDKLRTERESFKQARVAEEELEPLSVKYIRVSYAKASEIKSLVETVLSERGTVAFDERSNQIVVKDTRKGLQNVSELIKKIDLRTPQVLLETQIIEANRNLSRQLGAELGFQYIQSPATGNGTGLNFPSAIAVGGSADPTNANSITGSAFPVASTAALGSAVTMLFDSADGTRSLALRLSQLEQEGQVRIISKPAVATTNNKAAEIKSVEKYRVKLPNGGLSIASGSGASSSGSGDVATQTIEAGIILNVTPQASPDYYILLDIKAKSSSFGAKSVDGIPNEIERSASSSVLVSSGQTFALGGIYKINEQDRVSGVPFLKDIPVLGTFFRNTTTEQADEELLFFITPRIVEGSFEDASSKVIS